MHQLSPSGAKEPVSELTLEHRDYQLSDAIHQLQPEYPLYGDAVAMLALSQAPFQKL